MTTTPDKIATFHPDSGILWTGALLEGKGHLEGIGSLRELPIRQRSPLTLSIDLLTEENTETVDAPDAASVKSAVGRLIQKATDAGHRAGSSISYKQITSHSVEEASLKLGFSASYAGTTTTAKLEASSSAETHTVTASYIQQMFTVTAVLPQTPGGFFGPDFTETLLEEQIALGRIGNDNLPVFVGSVVYGRIMMFNFTSTASLVEIKAALDVSASNVAGVEILGETKKILEEGTINLVAVGGDDASARAAIGSGKLGAYFAAESPLTSARPISYNILNLADNSIARVSEATEYNIKECVPATVEPDGSEYTFTLSGIDYVSCDTSRPLACTCGIPRLIVQYDFWLASSDPEVKVAAFSSNVFNAWSLKVGDTIDDLAAKNPAAPGMGTTVKLYFDNDRVALRGRMLEGNNNIDWNWLASWVGTIPEGNLAMGARDPTDCTVMRFRYNVRKGQDLFRSN
jgi:hypothetical protein